MTNNTIPNVPRELLERVTKYCVSAPDAIKARNEVRALLSAPSPAGVDGLNTDRNAAFKARPESGCDWGSFYLGWKARGEVEQAIIDGLAVENHQLRRELNLRQSQIESSDHIAERAQRFAVQLRTERDQQAQRIGELEGLLRSCLPALSDGGCAALANRIDAALSADKEASK